MKFSHNTSHKIFINLCRVCYNIEKQHVFLFTLLPIRVFRDEKELTKLFVFLLNTHGALCFLYNSIKTLNNNEASVF